MKTASKFFFIAMTLAICVMMFTFSSCGKDDGDPLNPPENQNAGNDSIDTPNNPQESTLQIMRTCVTCDGKKICVDCNGTGKNCPACNETGRYCKECGTTGRCKECKGTKKCSDCRGTGDQNCHYCEDNPGYCAVCNGVGFRLGTSYTCTACNGTKKCSHCLDHPGKSGKRCWICDGTGACLHCRGEGTCPSCHGNPICSRCGGDGHCLSCGGSSQCRNCRGSGEIELSHIPFFAEGDEQKYFIHSKSTWSVSADVDWIYFSSTSGKGDYTITISAEKNNSIERRDAVITFTSGSTDIKVKVTQWGESLRLNVDPSSVFVYSSGTGSTVDVKSNTSWTVKAADSWVTCSPSSGSGDATVSVRASAYSAGTRYTTLTFTDASGNISQEVLVAQASSQDALYALKNFLEKPFGTVDIDMRTASYWTLKSAVGKEYKIGSVYEDATYKSYSFTVWHFDNASLDNWTYMGLPLSEFSVNYYVSLYNSSPTTLSIHYYFNVDKDKLSGDYKDYLNNIVQDVKYNLGITLKKNDSSGDFYDAFDDAKKNQYLVSVYDRSTYYSFCITVAYAR